MYRVIVFIIDFYYIQLIGNLGCFFVIKVDFNFVGCWVFDINLYQDGGVFVWGVINVFWCQVVYFVFDLIDVVFDIEIVVIYWFSLQVIFFFNVEFCFFEVLGICY